jgi:hypothetical protein
MSERQPMTRSDALTMLAEYEQYLPRIRGMSSRFPEDGSDRKAMRWLGFAQGVACALGIYSVEELRTHSRERLVTPPTHRGEVVREKDRTKADIIIGEVTTWLCGFFGAIALAFVATHDETVYKVIFAYMVLVPWARSWLRIRGKQ